MKSTSLKSCVWCLNSANLLTGPSYFEWTFQKPPKGICQDHLAFVWSLPLKIGLLEDGGTWEEEEAGQYEDNEAVGCLFLLWRIWIEYVVMWLCVAMWRWAPVRKGCTQISDTVTTRTSWYLWRLTLQYHHNHCQYRNIERIKVWRWSFLRCSFAFMN